MDRIAILHEACSTYSLTVISSMSEKLGALDLTGHTILHVFKL